ncbi:MAG: DUF11 domain-containing protein [Anaerolineae bacterium]|nr:DUF11 domain-containing protein [Anaerolineae bacterium]
MEATKVLAIVTVCVFLVALGLGGLSDVLGADDPAQGRGGVADGAGSEPIIVDHTSVDITAIPQYWIEEAKRVLHIAYGHTSHGSQLTTGMTGLVGFANGGGKGLALPANIFAWNNGGTGGALDLHDYAMAGDVGYYPQWVDNTRDYLGTPDPATGRGANNPDVNVIIWSWCGQASGRTEQSMIDTYLAPMTQLEQDYPGVTFVYMTGHADGTGESGNLHQRNQQIRDYCVANNKVLYDFYDIELYDPDGNYYGDKAVNDNCDYDSDGNGSRDSNWATEWQGSHTQNVDWYSCGCAHSQSLNCNQKAYAAWWLWARLAGWSGPGGSEKAVSTITPTLGDTVAYTVTVQNLTAPLTATVYVTDTVPTGLEYVGGSLNVVGGAGAYDDSNAPELTWSGVLSPTSMVTMTYQVQVTTAGAAEIVNTATVDAPGYQTITVTATIIVNPRQLWLPFVLRSSL